MLSSHWRTSSILSTIFSKSIPPKFYSTHSLFHSRSLGRRLPFHVWYRNCLNYDPTDRLFLHANDLNTIELERFLFSSMVYYILLFTINSIKTEVYYHTLRTSRHLDCPHAAWSSIVVPVLLIVNKYNSTSSRDYLTLYAQFPPTFAKPHITCRPSSRTECAIK